MKIKTTIFLTFLFLFLIVFEGSSKDSLSVNDSTKNSTSVKIGKVTSHKKTDKKIIILMVLGLSIPLAAGYYVIKKK